MRARRGWTVSDGVLKQFKLPERKLNLRHCIVYATALFTSLHCLRRCIVYVTALFAILALQRRRHRGTIYTKTPSTPRRHLHHHAVSQSSSNRHKNFSRFHHALVAPRRGTMLKRLQRSRMRIVSHFAFIACHRIQFLLQC